MKNRSAKEEDKEKERTLQKVVIIIEKAEFQSLRKRKVRYQKVRGKLKLKGPPNIRKTKNKISVISEE
jgi:hypothetical protein